MAFPSVTYTLTNGTTADASQVLGSGSDSFSIGFSDGTKSLNMAAGAFSGAVTISGAVTLGLSSSNLITWNGSLASSIPISTTNTFDIGSDPFGLASIYFGSGSSAHSTRLKGGSVSAAITLTLPITDGNARDKISSDGSGVLSFVPIQRSSTDVQNAGIVTSVSANALTVALKGADGNDPSATNIVDVLFRSATATTGTPSLVSITAATSLTVASSATLGHISAKNYYIFVYLLNNSGTAELAVSSSGSFDDGTIQSTTALSSGSTSGSVLYSTTSRSNVAVRLIGRLLSNQTIAGTWAANMSEISLSPFYRRPNSEIYLDAANGHGATNTKIRRWTNIVNNTGLDMTLTQDATNGDSITIVNGGLYHIDYKDNKSTGGYEFGVSVNSNALTTAIGSVAYSTTNGRIIYGNGSTDGRNETGRSLRLLSGDVIRAHDDGTLDASTAALSHFVVTRIGD